MIKITQRELPLLGIDLSDVLSPDCRLSDFELNLSTAGEHEGSFLEIAVEGPGSHEYKELEIEKIVSAVGAGLKALGFPAFRDGLRSMFKDAEHSLNDRPIEIPEDWQK